MVQFGGHYELIPTSVLVFSFTFGILSYFAATAFGIFSMSGFASLSAKVSLLGPVLPWLIPGSSAQDPSFGTPCSSGDHELLLSLGKLDGPVWHSGLSDFPVLLVADISVTVVSCIVASVAKTLSRSRLSRVEVHRWWCPWSVPPRPRRTRCIYHRQRPPRPRHWWPDREVRHQMIILLMMIPTF
jgi:hypothetical protein